MDVVASVSFFLWTDRRVPTLTVAQRIVRTPSAEIKPLGRCGKVTASARSPGNRPFQTKNASLNTRDSGACATSAAWGRMDMFSEAPTVGAWPRFYFFFPGRFVLKSLIGWMYFNNMQAGFYLSDVWIIVIISAPPAQYKRAAGNPPTVIAGKTVGCNETQREDRKRSIGVT